ncbi:MAG: class I SAM-dependent methyltransferase [Candidatus Omnitrophica bacterium]|nr:class I SAM-dependent methyltransferase [Candidatus Omnitrophota bacterium]
MHRSCYVCQGVEFAPVEGKVRDLPDMPILKCRDCGLVFLENFDHINDSFYEESEMRSGSSVIDWDVYIEKTSADDTRREKWMKAEIMDRAVLDFGCGAGGFLSKIKRYAKRCAGVEKDQNLQKIIQEKFDIDVYADIQDVHDKFDVITLFHVLEHFKDPRNLLIQLSGLLADNGRIIIEVPNAEDALLSLYKCKAFSEFTYWGCHLYLFNNKNLQRLVESAGLMVNDICQVQRYPLSNHLYWLAQGRPGGHEAWHFLDNVNLHEAYEHQLAATSMCDTIIASIGKIA